MENIGIPRELTQLIPEVRAIRAEQDICPSAKENVSVENLLKEIIESRVYQKDYNDISMGLLFIPQSYDIVIQSLQKILESGIWN